MKREGLSTRDLAALRLPGAPGSHQGWEKHAVTHGWEIREHPGRGRGGMVREFMPPPAIAAIINRHQAGEKVTEEEVRQAMVGLSRNIPARRSTVLPARKVQQQAISAENFGHARFSAWLMSRMMTSKHHGSIDESLQLDRHELALRVLLLVAERERCRLEDLAEKTEIVDHAISLAIATKPR